jgi:predicted nucleic acid-binding protein
MILLDTNVVSGTPDGYIAAIAAAHGFAVASRDASAFTAAGLRVIDPWTVAT